ncbi:MAG TPA: CoA-binding protein [Dehalococcoidia bacterium]|nr:CoA-binding protein [Dehalococcoidia bacterium]
MPVDPARLERMLNPRTLVVVGDKGPTFQWLTNQKQFTGDLYSVQVDPNEIKGIEEKGFTNFTSMEDVPGEVDLVICAVPRQIAPMIVTDAIKKNVGGVSMFTSGFAETDEPEGIELQKAITEMAPESGLPIVGPNCMGLYNRRLGVKFTGDLEQGEEGDVSVLAQSGTHTIGLSMALQGAGIKVSRGISMGNAIILNECDYLEYLLEDEHTSAIAMYVEGTKDGRRLFELLQSARGKKPIVLWRGGRSQAGARAIHSHTASLASSGDVWAGMLRQVGVIPVDSGDEVIDTMAALVNTKPSTKRNLALIAMTGGQSVAITDQFERAGFTVPELSQASYDRLAEFFTVIGGSYRNPFDAASTVGREEENLEKLLDILADEPAIEGGIAIEVRTQRYDKDPKWLDATMDLLDGYRERTGQPVIMLAPSGGVMSAGGASEAATKAGEAITGRGYALYSSFQRGAEALGRVVSYYEALDAG